MKKGTLISLIALLVSIAGLMIALIAYFKRRSCALCDDMESDMVEFYDEDDDCYCGGGDCSCGCDDAPSAEAASATEPDTQDEFKF